MICTGKCMNGNHYFRVSIRVHTDRQTHRGPDPEADFRPHAGNWNLARSASPLQSLHRSAESPGVFGQSGLSLETPDRPESPQVFGNKYSRTLLGHFGHSGVSLESWDVPSLQGVFLKILGKSVLGVSGSSAECPWSLFRGRIQKCPGSLRAA